MSSKVRIAPAAVLGLILMASNVDAQSRASWTSDRRDFAEGDVITVLIDEYTVAASNQGDFASDRRFRDLGVGASQSIIAGLPGGGADVTSSNQAESRRSSDASRQNRFQGEMTVRVLGLENGMLRVEGKKTINIDDKSEELVLRGLVRPEDISAANMVDSWRVAESELVYTSTGTAPKSGIIGRLLGVIWP